MSELAPSLKEVNLGATAQRYRRGYQRPSGVQFSGHPEIEGTDRPRPDLHHISRQRPAQVCSCCSGVFKRSAVKLLKICNDLRMLFFGPQTGFNEIFLPAIQADAQSCLGKPTR